MLDTGKVSYENHLGNVIEFGDETGIHLGDTELFDYTWNYSTALNSITSVSRGITEIPVKVVFDGNVPESRNRFFEAVEVDAINGVCGKLFVGGWWRRGMFVSCSRTEYYYADGVMIRDMKFVAEDGMWTHDITKFFSDGETRAAIVNEGFTASPVTIVALGPFDSLSVSIGDNNYDIAQSAEEGDRLIVDGLGKTITLHKKDGTEVNALSKREGRQVEGSGYYVFERMPPGYNEVTWRPKCDMYVTVHEQRSETRCR